MVAPKSADWIAEFSNATGTGAITLDGPIEGFAKFSVVGNGSQVYYTVQEGLNKEIGLGTISADGSSLARTRIIATIINGSYTKGGSPLELKGFSEVYATIPAELLSLIYDTNDKVNQLNQSILTKPIAFGPETFASGKLYTMTRDADGDYRLTPINITRTAANGDAPETITVDAKLIQNLEAIFKQAVTFEGAVILGDDLIIGDKTSTQVRSYTAFIENADSQWTAVEFKPSANGDAAQIVFSNEAGQQGIMSIGANGMTINYAGKDINVGESIEAIQTKLQDLQQQIDNLPTGGGAGPIPYATETVIGGIRVIVKGDNDANRELYIYTKDPSPSWDITSFLNGDAELDTQHWVNEDYVLATRDSNPSPVQGTKYFTGGSGANTKAINKSADIPADTHKTYAELIAMSKGIKVTWKQSSYEGSDAAAVGIRQLSGDGTVINETIAPMESSPSGSWSDRELFVPLQTGVVGIDVIMSFHRNSGSNNDGYIDDIRLRVEDAPTPV